MLAILRSNKSKLTYLVNRTRWDAVFGGACSSNWSRGYCSADRKIQIEKLEPPIITKKEKLKKAIKEYGTIVLVFHVTISIMSLAAFYLLISSGIDVVSLLRKYESLSDYLTDSKVVGASNFVIAYTIHKLFAPARIAITLSVSPLLVRHLRSKGFLVK